MKRFASLLIVLFVLSPVFAKPQKIGLALSGGGARALAQIGILKAIDSLQIPVDVIAGSSMGSLIGALYAVGYSGKQIEQIFITNSWNTYFDESIKREDIYIGQKRWNTQNLLQFPVNRDFVPNLPSGQISGMHILNKIFELTAPYVQTTDFSEFPTAFFTVATEVETSSSKLFSRGNLSEVILASLGFPIIFRPFEIDSKTYIDGGILNNFPADVLHNQAVDYIIGVKTIFNSQKQDETFIDVLNRAFSISIDENSKASTDKVDLLLFPQMTQSSTFDFDNVAQYIAIGEGEAAKHLTELSKLSDPKRFQQKRILPTKKVIFDIQEIDVVGREFISSTKVKELAAIKEGKKYSYKEILQAVYKIYNSELFFYVYPKIEDSLLTIVVKEKPRQHIDMYAKYNNNDLLSVGALLSVNNRILKNSRLLLDLQIGDKKEINLDYVKNFGEHFGIYYRIYNYLKQQTLYRYDQKSYRKTSSEKIFEFGNTEGIGLFYPFALITEFYYFYFNTKSEDDISLNDITKELFFSSGFGVKLYHETLDEAILSMRGKRLLVKYHSTTSFLPTDTRYQKFIISYKGYTPITSKISAKTKFEYGSHFEDFFSIYDPFYIGGMNSFFGYYEREYASPVFKIYTLGLRAEFEKKLFADVDFNLADLRSYDQWSVKSIDKINFDRGWAISLGKKIFNSSIKTAYAHNVDNKRNYFYLNIGYGELDPFELSRK